MRRPVFYMGPIKDIFKRIISYLFSQQKVVTIANLCGVFWLHKVREDMFMQLMALRGCIRALLLHDQFFPAS